MATTNRAEAPAPGLAGWGVAIRAAQGFGGRAGVLSALIPFAVLFAIWHTAATFWFRPYVLPGPMPTFWSLVDFVSGQGPEHTIYSHTFVKNTLASLSRILLGFGLGAASGILFGLIVASSRNLEQSFDPLINSIRNISVTAWLPLSIVWFGLGSRPAIFLIFIGVFFPVLINTMDGVRYVEPGLIRAALMLGTPRRNLFFRVRLPAALPSIITGLRVGSALAWALVVVAEMAGAQDGLGWVLMDARLLLLPKMVIAVMVCLGVLGYASDRLLQALSAYLLSWKPSSREA